MKKTNVKIENLELHQLQAYLKLTHSRLDVATAYRIVKSKIRKNEYVRYNRFSDSSLEKLLYSHDFPKIDFSKLKRIIDAKIIEDVRSGHIDSAGDLSDLTKLKPKFSQEDSDEAYLSLIRNPRDIHTLIRQVKSAFEYIGQRPSNKVAEKILLDVLDTTSNHILVSDICNVLQYKPAFNIMKDAYDRILLRESDNIPGIGDTIRKTLHDILSELKRITSVTPQFTNETAQKAYNHILQIRVQENYKLMRMMEIKEETGFRPDWSDSLVQKMYAGYVAQNDYSDLIKLYEITNVKPVISPKEAQKIFSHLLEDRDFDEAKRISKILAQRPSKKTIRAAYQCMQKEKNFIGMLEYQKYVDKNNYKITFKSF